MRKRKIIHINLEDLPESVYKSFFENKAKRRKKKLLKNAPKITDLNSLIEIAEGDNYYKNIDNEMLRHIFPQLLELQKIIGMTKLKKTLFHQIIYYLQKLNKNTNEEYLHTVIMGNPGCGKTTIAKIIGGIYCNLGILSNKKIFKIAKRDDFIAEYLGQTAIKTKKLLKSCLGGVLFIDEVYALGPGQKDKDSYSKEAIDTINVFLSENKDNFCCIIAGYEEKIKKCFFSVNPGLERRFQWSHTIETYSPEDLSKIFAKMVNEIKWEMGISTEKLSKLIKDNEKFFNNSGGDIEMLLSKCKMAHAQRVFSLDTKHKFILTGKDILKGMEIMTENKIEEDKPPAFMYT